MAVDHREALTALDRAYAGIEEAVADLTPTGLLTRTRCHGWLVVDLLFHLLGDAQHRLVALVSPAPGPADRDHVSYWTGFAAEANTRRRPPGGSGARRRRSGTGWASSRSGGRPQWTSSRTSRPSPDAHRRRTLALRRRFLADHPGHALDVGPLPAD